MKKKYPELHDLLSWHPSVKYDIPQKRDKRSKKLKDEKRCIAQFEVGGKYFVAIQSGKEIELSAHLGNVLITSKSNCEIKSEILKQLIK